jgi:hypothetical protein
MAPKRKRMKFDAPVSVDYTILDGNGNTYGHLRVKPSSILWKSRHDRRYYNATIEDFAKWIKNHPKARRTQS